MVGIIKAQVITNSQEHEMHRVKLKASGIWEESPYAAVVGASALKKGDWVMVDVSRGYADPIVLGKVRDSNYKTNATLKGTQVFESLSSAGWSAFSVDGNKVLLENGDGSKILLDGSNVEISAKNIKVTGGNLEMKGKANNDQNGPFNCIPVCPYSGAPHSGSKVSGT